MVRPFADPRVGGVQARFISSADQRSNVARQELKYNDRELEIKKGQSVDGVVIGAYGACYALRKNLYTPVLPGYLVDDFYIFMKVLEQGCHTVFADDSLCELELSGESREEFRRKVRIGTGNFQNFFALNAFYNPLKNRASFYYWSHKVLRWFTPFLLIICLISNFFLVHHREFYSWLLAAQASGYGLVLLDYPLKRLSINTGPLRYASHFVAMNLALLVGFFKYLKGGTRGTWR